MKTNKKSKVLSIVLSFALIFASITLIDIPASASQITKYVSGRQYELGEKSDYVYSSDMTSTTITSSSQFGQFSISGDMTDLTNTNGYTSYLVNSGVVTFSYTPNGSIINAPESDWHLIEDSSKKVNGVELDGKVKYGALVLQSSADGITWITDLTRTNIAGSNTDFVNSFYETKQIQQINGCYYRIIIAYEVERTYGESQYLHIDQKEAKKYVEVYEFYLRDDSSAVFSGGAHPNTKKVVGDMTNVTNTGKDNGYSGNNAIDNKDPHYGWKLGEFCIKGYTNTADYQGEEYFLKNLGDAITLDFTLLQDINCLNGKSNLSIAEDTNGYDQYFQVEKTNFKHGTLIIRFTDFQGNRSDPIVYTDFLAAYARTGADTRVQLFEEGDYEVALDYEICDSTRIDSYTNYRMYFTFKIRNGNNMVYAFDNNHNQLSDGAWTSGGFTIDTANSHYLTVTVDKYALVEGVGGFSLDQSWSRTASDGNSYSDAGKYVVTVSNRYQPNGDVTKTFYVGNDPFLKALSVTGLSVKELNEKLSLGYEIASNGTLIAPPEPEPETIVEETEPIVEDNPVVSDEIADADTNVDDQISDETVADSSSEEMSTEIENIDTPLDEDKMENNKGHGLLIFVLIVIVAAMGLYILKIKSGKNGSASNKEADRTPDKQQTSDELDSAENENEAKKSEAKDISSDGVSDVSDAPTNEQIDVKEENNEEH